jgi:hypothetical protein
MNIGKNVISKAVWSIYQATPMQRPQQLALLSFLLYLRPRAFNLNKDGIIITWLGTKEHAMAQYQVGDVIRRIPLINEWDILILNNFVNSRYIKSDKLVYAVRWDLAYREVERFAEVLFERLGIKRTERAITTLIDLRIYDLVVNGGFDYGWLRKNAGFYHTHFNRNIFHEEISQHLENESFKRCARML